MLAVPLLPLLPREWEASMEEELRQHLSQNWLPIGLVWLLPAGRVALWFISCVVLALTLTLMPPILQVRSLSNHTAIKMMMTLMLPILAGVRRRARRQLGVANVVGCSAVALRGWHNRG